MFFSLPAKQEPTPSKATFPELTTGGRAVDGLAFHPRLDGVHYERRLKSAVKLRQRVFDRVSKTLAGVLNESE